MLIERSFFTMIRKIDHDCGVLRFGYTGDLLINGKVDIAHGRVIGVDVVGIDAKTTDEAARIAGTPACVHRCAKLRRDVFEVCAMPGI